MIEFAFVMVINLMPEPLEDWKYLGHFRSCQEAVIFVDLHYPDQVPMEYKCLQKEYIHLPKDTQFIYRDMKHGSIRYYDTHKYCKFRRDCNE